MAQNKLETQIKEQLNAREIKPTEMAWDRLDAMLLVVEEKKATRSPFLSFRFIGIDASVLVLVSNQKSSPSFNQKNQKTTINPLINKEKEVQFQNQEVIAEKDLPVVETKKEIVVSYSSKVNLDDLLASASKKSENKPKIKVNANSLLSQIDGELDQSFRDKVLTKISKNYKEVKVALATRNQQ